MRDRHAVLRDARLSQQGSPALLSGLGCHEGALVGLADRTFRTKDEKPLLGVQNGLVAVASRIHDAADIGERRQAHRAGQNGGMPCCTPFLQDKGRDPTAVPIQQLRRSQPARHQNRPGHITSDGTAIICPIGERQLRDHPISEILDIDETLAQIGIRDPTHAIPQLGHDPHDGSLGRKACIDQTPNPLQPNLHPSRSGGRAARMSLACPSVAVPMSSSRPLCTRSFAIWSRCPFHGRICRQHLPLRQARIQTDDGADDEAIRQGQPP